MAAPRPDPSHQPPGPGVPTNENLQVFSDSSPQRPQEDDPPPDPKSEESIALLRKKCEAMERTLNFIYTNRDQKNLVDFHLVCHGERIPCHKAVLAANSEYFREMFAGHNEEMVNDTFDVPSHVTSSCEGLQAAVHYMYTKDIMSINNMAPDKSVEMWKCASYFQVDGLKAECQADISAEKSGKAKINIKETGTVKQEETCLACAYEKQHTAWVYGYVLPRQKWMSFGTFDYSWIYESPTKTAHFKGIVKNSALLEGEEYLHICPLSGGRMKAIMRPHHKDRCSKLFFFDDNVFYITNLPNHEGCGNIAVMMLTDDMQWETPFDNLITSDKVEEQLFFWPLVTESVVSIVMLFNRVEYELYKTKVTVFFMRKTEEGSDSASDGESDTDSPYYLTRGLEMPFLRNVEFELKPNVDYINDEFTTCLDKNGNLIFVTTKDESLLDLYEEYLTDNQYIASFEGMRYTYDHSTETWDIDDNVYPTDDSPEELKPGIFTAADIKDCQRLYCLKAERGGMGAEFWYHPPKKRGKWQRLPPVPFKMSSFIKHVLPKMNLPKKRPYAIMELNGGPFVQLVNMAHLPHAQPIELVERDQENNMDQS